MKKYRFHWLNGNVTEGVGNSSSDALARLGYGYAEYADNRFPGWYEEIESPETKKIRRTCKKCKTPFYIESEHFDWFKMKRLKPFTHCPKCRKERREEKNARQRLRNKTNTNQ